MCNCKNGCLNSCDCGKTPSGVKKGSKGNGKYWLKQLGIGYIFISVVIFAVILANNFVEFMSSLPLPPAFITLLGVFILVGVILITLAKENMIEKPDFKSIGRFVRKIQKQNRKRGKA